MPEFPEQFAIHTMSATISGPGVQAKDTTGNTTNEENKEKGKGRRKTSFIYISGSQSTSFAIWSGVLS